MNRSRNTAWALAVTLAAAAPLALAGPNGPTNAEPAPPPSRPAREALPGPPLAEGVTIPSGARADVLLWKQTMDWQNELVIQRSQAEALLRRFHRERHDARLAALVAQAPEGGKARLHAIRQRLGFAWKEVDDVMAKPWPIDPRLSCRLPLQDFEGAMAPRPSDGPAVLLEARVALNACRKRLSSVLEPLRSGNQKLAAAFAEAERSLASPPSAEARGE